MDHQEAVSDVCLAYYLNVSFVLYVFYRETAFAELFQRSVYGECFKGAQVGRWNSYTSHHMRGVGKINFNA